MSNTGLDNFKVNLKKNNKMYNTFNFMKQNNEEINSIYKENDINENFEFGEENLSTNIKQDKNMNNEILNNNSKIQISQKNYNITSNKTSAPQNNLEIYKTNFSIQDEIKYNNLHIQTKEQSFNLYGNEYSSSENSLNQFRNLNQINENSNLLSDRGNFNNNLEESELMGVNNLSLNKVKLKKNIKLNNEHDLEIDNFIQNLKIKNISKNMPLSQLKNQKEQELIQLKLKRAEINKQREELNNNKKIAINNCENDNNEKEIIVNNDKDNQSIFRKLISSKNKTYYNPLKENMNIGKKSYISIFEQYNTNTYKKSYVSIFDEHPSHSRRIDTDNYENSNLDIQIDYNKEEYDFFDTQKFQDIKKNMLRDTSKINVNNLFKDEDKRFNLGKMRNNNSPKNLYLNKVKKDVQDLEKAKINREKLNLKNEKKNSNFYFWENKSNPNIHKSNLKKGSEVNFIMPANTLEDVIDAKANFIYGNNLNNK